ncbi:MAG TPA: hypothetical protein VFA07_19995 [Chthonomonadaceae bacterium]|nr:hypothetical protein [Chthonomonadaceae bacterium]
MRTQRGITYGLVVTILFVLALSGWTRATPASGQNDPAAPTQPPLGPPRFMGGGPAAIAASGDYVYVLRGGTVYQMKASDLSVVTQKDLPTPTVTAPTPPPGAGGNPP